MEKPHTRKINSGYVALGQEGIGIRTTRATPETPVSNPTTSNDQSRAGWTSPGRVPDPGSERSAVSVTEQRPRRRDGARAGVVLGYHVDDDLVGLVAVNAPHAFTTVTRTMLATAHLRVSTSRSVPAQTPAGYGPGSPPNGISQIDPRYA